MIIYKGMKCKLLRTYMGEDCSLIMICNSYDLEKAYSMGFDCLGYPNEIAKKITEEEYNILITKGHID